MQKKSKIRKFDDPHKESAMLKEVLSLGHGFVVTLSTFSDKGQGAQAYKASEIG